MAIRDIPVGIKVCCNSQGKLLSNTLGKVVKAESICASPFTDQVIERAIFESLPNFSNRNEVFAEGLITKVDGSKMVFPGYSCGRPFMGTSSYDKVLLPNELSLPVKL